MGLEAPQEGKMTESQPTSTIWTEDTPHTVGPDRPAGPPPATWHLDFGLSATVAALLIVAAVSFAASAALTVAHWVVWSDWMGEGANFFDYQAVEDAEGAAIAARGVTFFVVLVTVPLFLVWFNQAYKAGRSRGATNRRWGSGWAVGSWFLPFANLVIPKLVMNEADRMLNPWAGLPPIQDRWCSCPRLLISDIWWVFMLIGAPLFLISPVIRPEFVEDSNFGTYLGVSAIELGVYAVAAGFAGATVFIIGKRGRQPG